MDRLLDVLASGVHDTKNQLFFAESLLAVVEAERGVDLAEARYAIENAAGRLRRTLSAYHLLRHDTVLAAQACVVADLCAEVALAQRRHLEHAGMALTVECCVDDAWIFDRDLVADILHNAVHNAGRFARRRVLLTAVLDAGWLCLRVEDDGPGFARDAEGGIAWGTGLLVAERVAALHERPGRPPRRGTLRLDNGGALGGAVFELRLP